MIGRLGATGCDGTTLIEVVVALAILTVGGTMSAHLLSEGSRALETAELEVHAALVFYEATSVASSAGSTSWTRNVGPGTMRARTDSTGAIEIRYIPGARMGEGVGRSRAFARMQVWTIGGRP